MNFQPGAVPLFDGDGQRVEIERLIDAALEAGALGAKLAGSGGGGIVVALVTPETAAAVARAVEQAGGTALQPALAVPGATVLA